MRKKRIIPLLKEYSELEQFKGLKVKVYYNLHKKCYSVKCQKTGLVLFHANVGSPLIILKDVCFQVSQKGRERVLAEKVKNVHAYVNGTLSNYDRSDRTTYMVTYDPYKYSSFVRTKEYKDNWQEFDSPKPIQKADFSMLFCQWGTNKPLILAYN